MFVNKSKPSKSYRLNPQFGISKNKIDDFNYELRLAFSLHDVNEVESPFDIDLEISGLFQFKDTNEKDIEVFMNTNAVSILFPYLRSILSTSMSSLLVSPIVLPVIDGKALSDKLIKNS